MKPTIKDHISCGTCATNKNYHPFRAMKVQSQLIDFGTAMPVESVHVYLQKNPNIGIITDVNGYFELDAMPDDVVVFSHVGYEKESLKAINIQSTEYLQEASNMLDEVIVIAKKKKKWGILAAASLLLVWIVSNGNEEETVKAKV